MLVDINLLPKKEEKNRSLLMLFIIIGMVLGVGLFSILYFANGLEKKTATTEQKITSTKQLLEIAQLQLADLNQSSAVSELENAVKWADDYPVESVTLLQRLTAMLPERGFIQTFSYQAPGTVTLQVQFDTNREAAYFLNNLNDADWVTGASLQGLTTSEIEEDEATETDKEYVPRYVGQYALQINKEKLDEVSSDKQGGNAS